MSAEPTGYLHEAGALLWPPPASITLERAGAPRRARRPRGQVNRPGGQGDTTGGTAPDSEFFLLPGAGRPRLVVPAIPRAAAAAVRRYGEPGSAVAWLGTRALAAALASGLGPVLTRRRMRVRGPAGAETIESYLTAVLGRDLRVSMHLGAPRANRKPVLQLLTPRGAPVGFAKIGVNPLTRDLVRAEREALARLGGAALGDVTVPRVLHHGVWHGLEILVLSTLPVWQRRRRLPAARLIAAMSGVARVDGLSREHLADGGYLRRLRARLAAADDGAQRAALAEALDTVAARAGDAVLAYGAWHGDWTPWNMASTDLGLLVWDWERFTRGVPVGFDALHHRLQTELVPGRREPRAAAVSCIERAPELLAPFEVDAAQARLTAVLYLADLAIRYLTDRQEQAGAVRGAAGRWLIPAITGEVTRL
jgi:Phosphotransferase enzyme family